MSQRHSIQNDATMLVTTVTMHRSPIFANASYAREAIDTLYRVQEYHPFFLFGFVIMPDHIHLLVRVMEPETISDVMNVYKSGLVFNLGFKKMWQPRFHIQIVDDASKALLYIHENPVRKGLSADTESYPWSSACGRWDVAPLDV